MDSILTSIKKLLGPEEAMESFDPDIIVHINTAFAKLYQLGVGPSTGFSITDKSSVWTDYISESPVLEMVKTYVYLKTKLVFDPPASSVVIESMKQEAGELEWRICQAVDSPITTTTTTTTTTEGDEHWYDGM